MPCFISRRRAFVTLSLISAAACSTDKLSAPADLRAVLHQASIAASPVTLYGPVTVTRSTGKPKTDAATFTAHAGDPLTLHVTSTSPQGLSAVVVLNGDTVFNSESGSTVPATITRVALASNSLVVRQAGKPGSTITLLATVPGVVPLPTAGLVLHYPLNGTATDVSGSGLHGAVTNGEWVADRDGLAGSAWHVPTNNAWIETAIPALSPISFTTAGAFTASLWVKMDSLPHGPENGVIATVGRNSLGWGFQVTPSGTLYATMCTPSEFCHSTTEAPGDVPNLPLAAGQWVHLAMTYDGGTGTITFYRNGQRAGVSTVSFSSRFTDLFLEIGTFPLAPQYWFGGTLDDVRMYNRVLSSAEVAQLATP
jgi:hypothetical protein